MELLLFLSLHVGRIHADSVSQLSTGNYRFLFHNALTIGCGSYTRAFVVNLGCLFLNSLNCSFVEEPEEPRMTTEGVVEKSSPNGPTHEFTQQ